MLELGDSKLELVPFLPGDEPELTQDAVERGARLLSHANRVAAPARRRVVDPTLHLVAAHSASHGEGICELVGALRRERDGTDECEQEAPSGLVHVDAHAAAAGGARASPARPLQCCRRRRRPWRPGPAPAWARRPQLPRPPRTPPRGPPW